MASAAAEKKIRAIMKEIMHGRFDAKGLRLLKKSTKPLPPGMRQEIFIRMIRRGNLSLVRDAMLAAKKNGFRIEPIATAFISGKTIAFQNGGHNDPEFLSYFHRCPFSMRQALESIAIRKQGQSIERRLKRMEKPSRRKRRI